ncbi:MAG: hypothetical protein K1X55_01895 [Chitinophagales bacterium]|nr:hypothetical protein [Chitinophagales bacterium]
MVNVDATILNQKLEHLQWLSAVEDVTIIQKIRDLKKEQSDDWNDDTLTEEQKKGIIDAMDDIRKNGGIKHSDVMRKLRNSIANAT